MVMLKKSWEQTSGNTQREYKISTEGHEKQIEEDNTRDIIQWIEYRNSHTSRGNKKSVFANSRF